MVIKTDTHEFSELGHPMTFSGNFDLFSRLSYGEYEEPGIVPSFIHAKRGEYIYFESHYLNKLFFIKEGYIKIGYIDNNGNEITKEVIQKGDVFGQFSLERCNMNGEFALAYKSDVSLSAFNIDSFKKILQNNTAIAFSYSQKVAKRLRKIENRLVNLLHADVRTRLMRFLYEMIEFNNENVSDNTVILDNFLTHDDIARMIGSTRQTVTSMFNETHIQKNIRITRKNIVINDVKALVKLAAY